MGRTIRKDRDGEPADRNSIREIRRRQAERRMRAAERGNKYAQEDAGEGMDLPTLPTY